MNESERIINFNDFANTQNAEGIFNGEMDFRRITSEPEMFHVRYKIDSKGNIQNETFNLTSLPLGVTAHAQKIPTIECLSYEDKQLQKGYVFNGVIYVSSTEPAQGLNVGGRILCFVPEEINDLEKLILGKPQLELTEDEIQKRLDAIRRGYPSQIKQRRESESDARHSSFSEGESSGSWKNRHGYFGY